MSSTKLINMRTADELTDALGRCGWAWSYPGDSSRHHGLETYYSFTRDEAPTTESNLYRHARFYLFTGNNQPGNTAEFGVAFEALADDEEGNERNSPFLRFRELMADQGWRAWLAVTAQELGLLMRFTYGGIGSGGALMDPASLRPESLNRGIATAAEAIGWTGVFLSRHGHQQELVSRKSDYQEMAARLFPLLLAAEPQLSS